MDARLSAIYGLPPRRTAIYPLICICFIPAGLLFKIIMLKFAEFLLILGSMSPAPRTTALRPVI